MEELLESLEPAVWTRNSGADSDDEGDAVERKLPVPLLSWSPSFGKRLAEGSVKPQTLLVALSQPACVFLHVVLSQRTFPKPEADALSPVGSILNTDKPLTHCDFAAPSLAPASSSAGCFLYAYKHNPSVLVLMAQAPVAPEAAWPWVRTLVDALKPARTVVLDCVHVGTYFNEKSERPDPPLLRCVKSAAFVELEFKSATPSACPVLETSNLVHSLPATFISYGELFGLPTALFLSLQDHHASAEVTMAFEPVLHTTLADLGLLSEGFKQADVRTRADMYAAAMQAVVSSKDKDAVRAHAIKELEDEHELNRSAKKPPHELFL